MKNYWLLTLTLSSAVCLTLLAETEPGKPVKEKPDKKGWIKLFDGKTLSGWKAGENPESWRVENGIVIGDGERSHLFSPSTFTNMEYKAEVKLNHSGNSGMYFRATLEGGWPHGYEAQVENTSPDPQRTGSLYNNPNWPFVPPATPVHEQLVQDDTWWTQHVIAIGNHIIIKVNDKIVTDFIDEKNIFQSGRLAFQQHNKGSIVQFRNVVAKRLSNDEAAAWAEAKKDMPDIKK